MLALHAEAGQPARLTLRQLNLVLREHGAIPWRMAASDYRTTSGAGGLLKGKPVAASWDGELGPAMQQTERAVPEELVLGDPVSDLSVSAFSP